MLRGDRHALSRLFSAIERDAGQMAALMGALHPHTGNAYCIGVTGPPGAGKSTLVDGLVRLLRADGVTVGVLAVDPTSAFTGGALLGDRVRMSDHTLDDGVFVRSLATRGAHGGLSRVAGAAVRLLDAFGKDVVVLESVGVGQTELDIMGLADTVAVVLVPEAGDAVQAMKAGLIEIADIVVVNKSDRDGADRLASAVRSELRASSEGSWWTPPVVMTTAEKGEGVDRLRREVDRHRAESEGSSRLARRRSERRRREFLRAVSDAIEDAIDGLDMTRGRLGELAAEVEGGGLDPHSAAAAAIREGELLSLLAERQRE